MALQRIDKILANMGIGTRKEVKALIKSGAVKVDDRIVKDAVEKVDPYACRINVNGMDLQYKEFIYLMLNKPAGYITAAEDTRYPTVMELVPIEYVHYKLSSVGRLDIDTEGLLVMTNDGQLLHKLISPKSKVPKRYFARINKDITQSDIEAFERGINLDDGYVTLPAKLEKGQAGEAYITICEGKYHQVKRMFEALGKQVVYLKRLQIGGLKLDEDLPLGECRELTIEEYSALVGGL
jgi:16S rRNA pseudouridine516 synthase